MAAKEHHAGEGRAARPRGQRLASAIAIAAAVALFWRFAGAVSDGISWKKTSDFATVAPDYEEPDPHKARAVPDFALRDRYGNEVRLSRFAPVDLLIVNLWSSGCPACKKEIPSLSEMDRRLGSLGRVALLTITTDEKWEDVAHYFPEGTNLRVLFDPENRVVKGIFGTVKFPETFILDKARRIRARFDGERAWHTDVMFDYIKSFR